MECYVDYKIILSISVQVQSFIDDPTDPTLYVELLFLKEDTRPTLSLLSSVKKLPCSKTSYYYLYRTCNAINIQDKAIKGLSLSPIRLSFQQKPDIPVRFINGCPGTCS